MTFDHFMGWVLTWALVWAMNGPVPQIRPLKPIEGDTSMLANVLGK